MANTALKYKTFDELLSEVAIDFTMYNTEGMINPAQLIKVAQKINYSLGLKINQTKEVMLDFQNGKVKLPDDFDVANHAEIVTRYTVQEPVLTGRQLEDTVISQDGYCSKCGHHHQDCACHKVYVNDCGTHYQIVEKVNTQTRVYEETRKVVFKKSVQVAKSCEHRHHNDTSSVKAEIKNGFIYIRDIDNGRLYLSYQGAMEDEDGNLMVLDHPMINEYYEYAIKERLLENLLINGEDVAQKFGLIQQKLRMAKNEALGLVNMPDFAELKAVFEMNRKAQYAKYYRMFSSHPSL